jgi:type II secretory pathway pseudopilin PulG
VIIANKKNTKGFTLIEIVVVIGLTVLIFAGLFMAFEYSLKLIAQSRAKMTALSGATDRMEYVRSLPYNDVGTLLGIPNGPIPQNRTVTLNGINFSERVLIEFVDDPGDGSSSLDSNGIISDYKKVKVEYTWDVYGVPNSFSLISNVVPRSIETNAGGGTFRVNVFDATVSPVAGADVRIFNTAGGIDVTRKTDVNGIALFTGAPAGSGYEFIVTAPGYSIDKTYLATTTLPNPATPSASVLESDVSTMNFQIDRVSNLRLKVFSSEVISQSVETFDDSSGVALANNTIVSSSSLKLLDNAGVYMSSGFVFLNPLSPTNIESWGVVDVNRNLPPTTDLRLRFYTSTSTASMIPDSDLPGNTAGFSGQFINISSLDMVAYPTIVVGAELSTGNTSTSSSLNNLEVSYVESRTYQSGLPINIEGNKVIGTDSASVSVRKFALATTTDANGEISLNDIEWDLYNFTLGPSTVITEACSANPFSLSPNTSKTITLKTAPVSGSNLRVAVNSGSGGPIVNATVELRRGASVWNRTTSWCGQMFISSLIDDSNYALEVSAPGYTTQTIDPYTVNSKTVQEIILVP